MLHVLSPIVIQMETCLVNSDEINSPFELYHVIMIPAGVVLV